MKAPPPPRVMVKKVVTATEQESSGSDGAALVWRSVPPQVAPRLPEAEAPPGARWSPPTALVVSPSHEVEHLLEEERGQVRLGARCAPARDRVLALRDVRGAP